MAAALPQCVQTIITSICEKDFDTTLAQFHPDGSFQDPTGHWQGLEQLGQFFTAAFAAVDEIWWEVGRTVVEGDRLAFEWKFGCRVVLGPVAGKTAAWEAVAFMELKDGKIWRYREFWDSLDPLGQLGVSSWDEVTGGML